MKGVLHETSITDTSMRTDRMFIRTHAVGRVQVYVSQSYGSTTRADGRRQALTRTHACIWFCRRSRGWCVATLGPGVDVLRSESFESFTNCSQLHELAKTCDRQHEHETWTMAKYHMACRKVAPDGGVRSDVECSNCLMRCPHMSPPEGCAASTTSQRRRRFIDGRRAAA